MSHNIYFYFPNIHTHTHHLAWHLTTHNGWRHATVFFCTECAPTPSHAAERDATWWARKQKWTESCKSKPTFTAGSQQNGEWNETDNNIFITVPHTSSVAATGLLFIHDLIFTLCVWALSGEGAKPQNIPTPFNHHRHHYFPHHFCKHVRCPVGRNINK